MRNFLFLIVCVPAFCYAQSDSSLVRRNDVVRFADGLLYTFSSPVRWDGKDWLTFGGVVAGTALLSLADEPIRDFWVKQDSKFLDEMERVGYHLGKPYSAFIAAGGFYLVGFVIKDEWAKDTGLMLGLSFLSSAAIQTFMKTAVGRARPDTEEGPFSFEPFSNEGAYHSFPSGHMTVAFSTSMVLASRVKSPVLKVIFYSGAAITAISRMYKDKHWFTDIAFGSGLAYFCANTAMERLESNKYRKPKDKSMSWQVSPFPGGLTLTARF